VVYPPAAGVKKRKGRKKKRPGRERIAFPVTIRNLSPRIWMTDNLLPEDGWQPLPLGGEEVSPKGFRDREADAAKFASPEIQDSKDHCPGEQHQSRIPKISESSTPNKFSPDLQTGQEGWQPLTAAGEEAFPGSLEAREGDTGEFPSEMIQDSEDNCTEEQRQSLYQKITAMSTPDKFRLAIHANREVRNLLIHDPKKMIALAVLKNRRIDEKEILRYAQKKELSEDVVTAIAKDPKWKKSYPMKLALVNNPKTPLSLSINLLSHLQERDLKSLSRGKDVPPAVKQKAHEILHQRNIK
jgi:hypothetical protein